MLTAEARVPTDRATRYLDQFCRHASHMGQPQDHRPRPHSGGDDAPPEVSHIAWSDTLGETTSTTAAPTATTAARRHPRLTGPLLLAGTAALVIVVHLGLLGGALATSSWTNWAGNIVLAAILLKIIAVGVHLFLRRSASGRGTAIAASRNNGGRLPPPPSKASSHTAGTVQEEPE